MSETKAPEAPQPPDIGRRTLTPVGYAICAVVPILIAAVGFTFLHFHYDKEDLVSGTRLHILTSEWKPGDPAGQAQVSGQLTLGKDGCMRLGDPDSGTTLVWPADYEATVQRVGPSDQLKVYDSQRETVARSSDTIELTGEAAEVGAYAGLACAPAADGQVFLVQSVPKITARE